MISENLINRITIKLGGDPTLPHFLEEWKEHFNKNKEQRDRDRRNIIKNIKQVYKKLLSKD